MARLALVAFLMTPFAVGSTTLADEAPGGDAPTAPPRRSAAADPLRGRGGVGFDGRIGLAATAMLAIVGAGVALGSRLRPAGAGGGLRVVGRAHLTGRHSVHLIRAGNRTLIVGVGPQGAPSLLGELDPTHPETTLADDRSGERA